MAAHHDIDMFLSDQTFSFGFACSCIAGVVAADNFEHTAVDAALSIDFSNCEVDAAENVFADGSLVTGHCIDCTDLDCFTGRFSCSAAGIAGASLASACTAGKHCCGKSQRKKSLE